MLPAQLPRPLPKLQDIVLAPARSVNHTYVGELFEECELTDKLGGESYMTASFFEGASPALRAVAPGDVFKVSATREYVVRTVTTTWRDGYSMVDIYAERSWYELLYAPWGRPPFLAGAPITHVDGLVRDTAWAPGQVTSTTSYGWAPKAEGALGVLAEVASTIGADLHFDPINKLVNLGTFPGYSLPPALVGKDIESVEREVNDSAVIDVAVGYSDDGLVRTTSSSAYNNPAKAPAGLRWGFVELPEGLTQPQAVEALRELRARSASPKTVYTLSGYSLPPLDVLPGDDLPVLNLDGAPLPNVSTTRVVEVVRNLVEPHKSSAVLSSSKTELADLISGEARTSAGIISITQTRTMSNKSGIVSLSGTAQTLTNGLMTTVSPSTLAGWEITQTRATTWSAWVLSLSEYSSMFAGTSVPACIGATSTSRSGAVATVRSQGDVAVETRRAISNVRQVVVGQIGVSKAAALSSEEDAALFGAVGSLRNGFTMHSGTPKPLASVHGELGVLSCGRMSNTASEFTASVWKTVAVMPPQVRPRRTVYGAATVYSDARASHYPVRVRYTTGGAIELMSRLTLARPSDVVLPRLVFQLQSETGTNSGYAPVLVDEYAFASSKRNGTNDDLFTASDNASTPTVYRHGNLVTFAPGTLSRWAPSAWGAGVHIHAGTIARGYRPLENTPKQLFIWEAGSDEPSFGAWWVTTSGDMYVELSHRANDNSGTMYFNPCSWVV